MKKKIIQQTFISIAVFGAVFYCFSMVDWMRVFNYPSFSFEKLLGDLYEEYYLEKQEQVADDTVTASLNTLLVHICEANDIDHSSIKLYCLKNEEVNAFAFPNRRVVVYSGLLTACEDETELAGVMAHEIAHIEKGHIMRLLVKEIGFQILLGQLLGKGGEIVTQTGKTISSSAYDRSLEREADATAVAYLQKANITTTGIANLFLRLAKEENNVFYTAWISTHPDSKERAQTIQKLSENIEINYQKMLSDEQWQKIKDFACIRFFQIPE